MQYTALNYSIALSNAYTGKKQCFQNFLMSAHLQFKTDAYGAKLKYAKGKRSYLEIAFESEALQTKWESQTLVIAGRKLKAQRALSDKKSYLSLSLSGVPLSKKTEITDAIKSTFDKLAKVAVIKPKLWEGTSMTSDKWAVTLDTTDVDDIVKFTSTLPRTIKIKTSKVFVTWKSAPAFCTFCKKNGHKRGSCAELTNANAMADNLRLNSSADSQTPPKKNHTKNSIQPNRSWNKLPSAEKAGNIPTDDPKDTPTTTTDMETSPAEQLTASASTSPTEQMDQDQQSFEEVMTKKQAKAKAIEQKKIAIANKKHNTRAGPSH